MARSARQLGHQIALNLSSAVELFLVLFEPAGEHFVVLIALRNLLKLGRAKILQRAGYQVGKVSGLNGRHWSKVPYVRSALRTARSLKRLESFIQKPHCGFVWRQVLGRGRGGTLKMLRTALGNLLLQICSDELFNLSAKLAVGRLFDDTLVWRGRHA